MVLFHEYYHNGNKVSISKYQKVKKNISNLKIILDIIIIMMYIRLKWMRDLLLRITRIQPAPLRRGTIPVKGHAEPGF